MARKIPNKKQLLDMRKKRQLKRVRIRPVMVTILGVIPDLASILPTLFHKILIFDLNMPSNIKKFPFFRNCFIDMVQISYRAA